ncbi:hypothetical protein QN410_02855, partial [Pseudomonas sp. Bout1]|nr:hypothetical protein [Pseudomonas sp. Bout1]
GAVRSRSTTDQEHSGLQAGLSVKSQGKSCRSWLAGDAGNSVFQMRQGGAIAGKPAPTVGRAFREKTKPL